jgi:small subunit ribosomal protein S3
MRQEGEYARLLHEDLKMREHILTSRKQAGISKVVIERRTRSAG